MELTYDKNMLNILYKVNFDQKWFTWAGLKWVYTPFTD